MEGWFIHSSQLTCAHKGSLCSTYYLQHNVSIFATPCGGFLKWLEYSLAVTSLIHIDVIILRRVVFQADLEHQDFAAAQFPAEEEQVHSRLFTAPKCASFESFWAGLVPNDYSDNSEDDPFDKDEKARGRVQSSSLSSLHFFLFNFACLFTHRVRCFSCLSIIPCFLSPLDQFPCFLWNVRRLLFKWNFDQTFFSCFANCMGKSSIVNFDSFRPWYKRVYLSDSIIKLCFQCFGRFPVSIDCASSQALSFLSLILTRAIIIAWSESTAMSVRLSTSFILFLHLCGHIKWSIWANLSGVHGPTNPFVVANLYVHCLLAGLSIKVPDKI